MSDMGNCVKSILFYSSFIDQLPIPLMMNKRSKLLKSCLTGAILLLGLWLSAAGTPPENKAKLQKALTHWSHP
jgi:hypothetical protein